MRKKLLMIAPRIPDLSNNRYERRFYFLINALARSYEVYFMYIQSMFTKEDTVKKMEDGGVHVIPFSTLKQKKDSDLEKRMEAVSGVSSFDLLFFNTHFTAKYYLPYLTTYARESIIVVDAANSQYISEMRFARESKDLASKVNMLKSAEVNRMKEIAVYARADAVIVDSETDKNELGKDIPAVDVRILPKCDEEMTKEQSDELSRLFSSLEKRKAAEFKKNSEVMVIGRPGRDGSAAAVDEFAQKVGDVITGGEVIRLEPEGGASLIETYNGAFRKISAEYALIAPEGVIIPAPSFEKLAFCVQCHPRHGISVPTSNLILSDVVKEKDLKGDFLAKHYVANFGYWTEVRKITGPCVMVRKELVDVVGLLDTRFATTQYALFDFCLRAFQSGYTTVLTHESFVYYDNPPAEGEHDLAKDHALLYKKWCDAGTEYLEMLGPQPTV